MAGKWPELRRGSGVIDGNVMGEENEAAPGVQVEPVSL